MITIEMLDAKDLSSEPQEWMSSYGKKEFAEAGDQATLVFMKSDLIFSARKDGRHLALCGTYRASLIGNVHLWFILAEKISFRDLYEGKDCGRHLLQYYPRVQTTVEVGYKAGERFARFAGFRPIDQVIEFGTRRCQVYEVR